jgi:hypothetical protein
MTGARLALAVGGVGAAAVTVVYVTVPAALLLTDVPELLRATVILTGPVAVILALTGAPHYGIPRSIVIALLVAALMASISLPVACYAVAHMMGGGLPGPTFMALRYLPRRCRCLASESSRC